MHSKGVLKPFLPENGFYHLSLLTPEWQSFRGQKTLSLGQFGYHPRTYQQSDNSTIKSHDFDSHECSGAKVKGVEETVGVEADPLNSMG